ncbi:MAG: DinB family protein [Bryobacteraceae bacterium]
MIRLPTSHLFALLALGLGAMAFGQQRTAMQDDLLREYSVPMQRVLDLAKAIPADKYSWRPDPGARSISEVIVHVSVNTYVLLEMIHKPFPAELYQANLPPSGLARQQAMFGHNPTHEKNVTAKDEVVALAAKAFAAGEAPLRETPADQLSTEAFFLKRRSTVGGIHLRMMAHLHEHLGQLIAYARSVGVVPPWSQ